MGLDIYLSSRALAQHVQGPRFRSWYHEGEEREERGREKEEEESDGEGREESNSCDFGALLFTYSNTQNLLLCHLIFKFSSYLILFCITLV